MVSFRTQSNKKLWIWAVAALFVLFVGFIVIRSSFAIEESPVTPTNISITSSTDEVFSTIYDQVSPSVVAISVTAVKNGQRGQGSGSGFVIDIEGHIVTNNHVVEGAQSIEVAFYDGTLARGTLVGVDPNSDLAVIQVDVSQDRLHPIAFANSDELKVGQTVLAIGSPFGQRWTLTSGIVSALDRTIQGLTQFSIGGAIQTDASINPGNSGGPLLNLSGEVVGVNSQILTESGTSSGVGFAIPGNLTQRVSRELIENGRVEYSYIGLAGGNVTLELMEALNLPNDLRGVVVSEVVAGGPAERAGLQSLTGTVAANNTRTITSVDIITAVDGQALTGMDDLITYLANNTKPGQTLTLSVLRDGTNEIKLDVTLSSRSAT